MISEEKAKEVFEYINENGFEKAIEHFSVSQDTLNRYIRLHRRYNDLIPIEPKDVTTVNDALLYGDTDVLANMRIDSVKVNTWGSATNQNKQVTVKLKPEEPTIDIKKIAEDFKNELLKLKQTHKTTPPVEYIRDSNYNTALLIALPDAHHSLLSWEPECGADYDIKISTERFMKSVRNLVEMAKTFKPEIIYLAINGDFFNADGKSLKTTGGTEQSVDSRWQKVFTTGWKLVRDAVDYCRQFANVKVVINSGNHDAELAYYMGSVLEAWYDGNNQVVVDNSPKHYKYFQHGNTLIGLTHGDGAKSELLPMIMATDVPQLWANTLHRYFFIGHYHAASTKGFQAEKEGHGCSVIVSPALSSASDWTYRKGYRSVPEAQAYVFSNSSGRIATFHYRTEY